MSACGCSPAYPDKAWHGSAEVIENVEMAAGTCRIRLVCPELSVTDCARPVRHAPTGRKR